MSEATVCPGHLSLPSPVKPAPIPEAPVATTSGAAGFAADSAAESATGSGLRYVPGAAEALVGLIRQGAAAEGTDLRVIRLATPPDVIGERPGIGDDGTRYVVVGERVVVT